MEEKPKRNASKQQASRNDKRALAKAVKAQV
jgi:hypothetical protein